MSLLQKIFQPKPRVVSKEPILMENIRPVKLDTELTREARAEQRKLADNIMQVNESTAIVRMRLTEASLMQMNRSK